MRVRWKPYTVGGVALSGGEGAFLPLSSLLRGVMHMHFVTYAELFQLLLVLIGIAGLFLQYLEHKKK